MMFEVDVALLIFFGVVSAAVFWNLAHSRWTKTSSKGGGGASGPHGVVEKPVAVAADPLRNLIDTLAGLPIGESPDQMTSRSKRVAAAILNSERDWVDDAAPRRRHRVAA